jgi:hypothetical protein
MDLIKFVSFVHKADYLGDVGQEYSSYVVDAVIGFRVNNQGVKAVLVGGSESEYLAHTVAEAQERLDLAKKGLLPAYVPPPFNPDREF